MATQKQRPLLVWVILIFYLFGTALGAFIYFGGLASILGVGNSPHETGASGFVLELFLVLMNLGGAVALFRLRRYALFWFIGAIVISSLLMMWHAPIPGYAFSGQPGFRAWAGSLALPVIVTAYTWLQVKTGILS